VKGSQRDEEQISNQSYNEQHKQTIFVKHLCPHGAKLQRTIHLHYLIHGSEQITSPMSAVDMYPEKQ
jgi:Icc-related predicted phosphoesterase